MDPIKNDGTKKIKTKIKVIFILCESNVRVPLLQEDCKLCSRQESDLIQK